MRSGFQVPGGVRHLELEFSQVLMSDRNQHFYKIKKH